jgi:membrane fusion protein, heavy metal efflux system
MKTTDTAMTKTAITATMMPRRMITAMAARRMRIDRLLRPQWAALVLLALLGACSKDDVRPGTQALPVNSMTHFTEATELFVEFRPLITGERTSFAAHLTWLADYKAVMEGTVDVVLSGGGAPTERFRIEGPRAPGISAPTIAPRTAGERQLQIALRTAEIESVHELGTVRVFESPDAAMQSPAYASPYASAEGEIGFLKEQQWQTDFAVEPIGLSAIRESVTAPAMVRASSEGSFIIAAPAAGLMRGKGPFPVLGDSVVQGQVIALLLPHLGIGTDAASLQSALESAQQAVALATAELTRTERLYAQQAISERRLEEARAGHQIALTQLRAAEQRSLQLPGNEQSGIELRAPIAGTVALVHITNGAAVNQGDPLFHIIDRQELWLEAQVSEVDALRLHSPSGAEFDVPGWNMPVEIRADNGGRLVGVGQIIDARTRSIPVIFAMRDPDPRIVLNLLVQARIFTGSDRESLSVPQTALIEDGGQRVVYVMRSGESFSRIPVRTGIRDGDRIEILEGLREGDRIVTRGAVQLRLAAATPEAMGHGHAH